jgi:hypothetical protein
LVPGEQRLIKQVLVLVFLLLALPALAAAQGSSRSKPLLNLQDKAERLYRQGHWERAHFIYVNELAVFGDKYAQYMAGYMFQEGRGVERDPVRASAWYRLAAESGAPEFVEVRDALLESLDDESLAVSDSIYIELRKQYSDLVLALNLMQQEREALHQGMTGSRLSKTSSSVTIVDPHSGSAMSRSEFERRLEVRIKLRLDYITKSLGVGELDADLSDSDYEMLAAQVDEHLRIIDDR